MIPTVNVDGLALIENNYKNTGNIVHKRTNMHLVSTECDAEGGGVDLNRNYGYKFGEGSTSHKECVLDTYHGPKAFSEVETQNMKKFILSIKNDLKFAMNFHCAGK